MTNTNVQQTEFCPKCKNGRNVKGFITTRFEETSDGHDKLITTVSYHCETCNTFVRSEDIEGQKDNSNQQS